MASPYEFKGINKADGLSDLLVNVIFKDSTGFIWLGTGKGLDRFDGKKIKHYPFNNVLQEQRIRINAICETGNGQIWVGNALGLWSLDENTGRLNRMFRETIGNTVNTLLYDGERHLYIGTENGFYVSDFTDIEQINISDRTFSLSNNIKGITRDDSGIYWLVTLNSVLSYNSKNKKVEEYRYPEDVSIQPNFRNITYLNNRLYLGTNNSGIISFDIGTLHFAEFVDVGSNIISSLSTDGEDLIYVSTDGNGIFFISQSKRAIVKSFRHDVNDQESIRSNSVYSLLVDDMQRIWVGFYQDGFDYSLYQSGLFKVYEMASHFSSRNLTVRSFLIGDNEKLIGTRDGLYFINEKSNTVKYFNRSELQSDLILSLAYYQDEYLIGTYGAGMYILNPQTMQLRRHQGLNSDILHRGHIFCFRLDDKGSLWIGSSEGVIRYNGSNSDLLFYTSLNSPLPEGNVYEIFFDSEQKGWICTDKGLALYDPVNGSVKTNLFPSDFFHHEKIHVMYEDRQQRLYFLPEKGDVFVSDLNMRSFSTLEMLPAIQTNVYTSIVEDSTGCLWLSSDGGLVRFCNNDYSLFNYAHGLPSPTFMHYAAHVDERGILWFGNAKGLIYVDPNEIGGNEKLFSRVVFSDLLINGESLDMGKMSDLQKSGSIDLLQDQNNIVFDFTDLSYTNPSSITFEYKMEPLDEDWRLVSGSNEISYYNLSPGNYRLLTRIPGKDSSQITIEISIVQSFFDKYLFFLLILIGIVLAASLYYYNIRKTKKIKKKEQNEAVITLTTENEDEKYRMNRLNKAECKILHEKLKDYMQQEKPYINKELKIADLAEALESSSHTLSYLFNQYLNISYYDFVNEWRITEFKKLVKEGASSKYTLNAMAELCGFSSRASFFRSFKKSIGITPSEYIKNAQNDKGFISQ